MNDLNFETKSPEETEAVGFQLAKMVPPGTLVALQGDLAAGKTCLVRGMAKYFAENAPVHSPTFTLVNQYGDITPLYHLDLYRLGDPKELADLGYEEIFDSDGVCVVEWSERAEGFLPNHRIDIRLAHGGGDVRTFHITNYGIELPERFDEIICAVLAPV